MNSLGSGGGWFEGVRMDLMYGDREDDAFEVGPGELCR
jgi:hypothetical protein